MAKGIHDNSLVVKLSFTLNFVSSNPNMCDRLILAHLSAYSWSDPPVIFSLTHHSHTLLTQPISLITKHSHTHSQWSHWTILVPSCELVGTANHVMNRGRWHCEVPGPCKTTNIEQGSWMALMVNERVSSHPTLVSSSSNSRRAGTQNSWVFSA